MALKKDVAGVEDIAFGVSTRDQIRKGQVVTINEVQAHNIPYNLTVMTDEQIDHVESLIEAHKRDFTNPHRVDPEDFDFAPLDHHHPISDVDGLQGALNNKADKVHHHSINDVIDLSPILNDHESRIGTNESDISTLESGKSDVGHQHQIADVENLTGTLDNHNQRITLNEDDIVDLETSKAPVVHTHQIGDVENLQTTLDSKMDDGDTFLTGDFIVVSNGVEHAGHPIILDGAGQIDASLMGQGMYFVAMYIPDATNEYPDDTGETTGAFWGVEGVDPTTGYTFTGGDLQGATVYNGDMVVRGEQEWGYRNFGDANGLFLRIDGSNAMTGSLPMGTNKIVGMEPGTAAGEAIEFSQIENFATEFMKLDGSTPMEASLDAGGFPIKNGQVSVDDTDYVIRNEITGFATAFLKRDGTTAMEGNLDVGGNRVVELSDGVDPTDATAYGQHTAHLNAIDNPHNVTAAQTGAVALSGGNITGVLSVGGNLLLHQYLTLYNYDGTDDRVQMYVRNAVLQMSAKDEAGVTEAMRIDVVGGISCTEDISARRLDLEDSCSVLNGARQAELYASPNSAGLMSSMADRKFLLYYSMNSDTDLKSAFDSIIFSSYREDGGFKGYHQGNLSEAPEILAVQPNIGEIKLYYGDLSKLGKGWNICDGTKGTPDLTGSFLTAQSGDTIPYIMYIGE